jgi:hypothetical protein
MDDTNHILNSVLTTIAEMEKKLEVQQKSITLLLRALEEQIKMNELLKDKIDSLVAYTRPNGSINNH